MSDSGRYDKSAANRAYPPEPGGILFWPARPGQFIVRAVDELGRSVTQPLAVELVSDGRPPD
jgi:hypothetical protein